MIKAIKALLVLLFVLPVMAYSVTPLELKTMQTRKFNKDADEVIAGIKSYCEDSGAQYVTPSSSGRLTPAELSRSGANPAGTKVTGLTCLFTPKIKIGLFGSVKDGNKYSQIKVDFLKNGENFSIVRIRLYTGFPPEQIVIPDPYSEIFKAIGDAMFIQAIPLEAVEQE
ncbi:MAG: hypothetical protein ACOYB1_11700 [Limnohabitans sp.]